jgi:hypothetical protein
MLDTCDSACSRENLIDSSKVVKKKKPWKYWGGFFKNAIDQTFFTNDVRGKTGTRKRKTILTKAQRKERQNELLSQIKKLHMQVTRNVK